MKYLQWCLLIIASLAAFCLQGCETQGPRYYIYMVNMTHHDFEGVGVYYNGRMAAGKGHLVKGGLASDGPVTLPVPAEAEVRWDDAGVHHAPKVKLEGIVPRNPVGMDIYFIIHEDGTVDVKYVSHSDVNAGVEATKGLVELRKELKIIP